jgi:hypothetical protein
MRKALFAAGNAGIGRDVEQHLAQVVGARAGGGGRAGVEREFLPLAAGGEDGEGDERALAPRQALPRPDRAPGAFGDVGLEVGVEALARASDRSTCASPSTAQRVARPSS